MVGSDLVGILKEILRNVIMNMNDRKEIKDMPFILELCRRKLSSKNGTSDMIDSKFVPDLPVQLEDPKVEIFPAGHCLQELSPVDGWCFPAGQGWQMVCPSNGWCSPAGHFLHEL
jgi:hypothetical protein